MRNRHGRRRFCQNNNRIYFNKSRSDYLNIKNRIFEKGFEYIGPCRCGIGPNAFYRNIKENKVYHYSEIVNINTKNASINKKSKESKSSKKKSDSSDVRFCYNCGASILPEAYYCSECGAYQEVDRISKQEKIDELKEQLKNIKNKIKNLKKKGG
ncbi:MAG: hypothetical protein ACTSRP_19815 [Candidatus Helarchaeota archaeon]